MKQIDQGFLALNRFHIRSNKLYKTGKFDQFHAFFYLLISASSIDRTTNINGELITLKKGQLIKTQRELASKWNWSQSKVLRFLNNLKVNQEIDYRIQPEVNSKISIITLLQYDFYIRPFELKENISNQDFPGEFPTSNNHNNLKQVYNEYYFKKKVTQNAFNRNLSQEEKDLIDDFIEWAYDDSNRFGVSISEERTREQIENTIRKYGYDDIFGIFTYCSEERYPWDKNLEELESISAYTEFWVQVRNLKDSNQVYSCENNNNINPKEVQ